MSYVVILPWKFGNWWSWVFLNWDIFLKCSDPSILFLLFFLFTLSLIPFGNLTKHQSSTPLNFLTSLSCLGQHVHSFIAQRLHAVFSDSGWIFSSIRY
jgi:hypothetical protein